MENILISLPLEIDSLDKNVSCLIGSLRYICNKWESLDISFKNYQIFLKSFEKFPNLRNNLELEFISSIDEILSEIRREFTIYKHKFTEIKAKFMKVSGMFKKKDCDEGWSYPPTENNIADLYINVGNMINNAMKLITIRELALFRFDGNKQNIQPETINEFIKMWES